MKLSGGKVGGGGGGGYTDFRRRLLGSAVCVVEQVKLVLWLFHSLLMMMRCRINYYVV